MKLSTIILLMFAVVVNKRNGFNHINPQTHTPPIMELRSINLEHLRVQGIVEAVGGSLCGFCEGMGSAK